MIFRKQNGGNPGVEKWSYFFLIVYTYDTYTPA
jgi:hypothetical protein